MLVEAWSEVDTNRPPGPKPGCRGLRQTGNGSPHGDRLDPMEVSLLYFDGCPNHHETMSLLTNLLDEVGWTGQIQLVNVDSPERADELSFRGSPTVLIDGVDPFLDRETPVGLSCRIYATAAGYQGTPPDHELRAAIARAAGT